MVTNRFVCWVVPVGVANDLVQGGDVPPVGGSSSLGEAEPDSLPGVAHGAALGDIPRVG
jgi:hypothetical protein